MRILMANEPRAYREVLAAAIQRLRPNVELVNVEPQGVDDAIMRVRPHLVVCSVLTATVQMLPRAWIMLYPDGAATSIICIEGQRTIIDSLELSGILSIIDEIAGLDQS